MGDVRKVFGVKGFPLTGMPECKETKWIVMTAYAGLKKYRMRQKHNREIL